MLEDASQSKDFGNLIGKIYVKLIVFGMDKKINAGQKEMLISIHSIGHVLKDVKLNVKQDQNQDQLLDPYESDNMIFFIYNLKIHILLIFFFFV